MISIRIAALSLALMAGSQASYAAAVIQNLMVEYRKTPLGIDVAAPRFSWQMAAAAGERGSRQTAYHLIVKDARGNVVWDTGRVESASSLGIRYEGRPLEPATRYPWTVTVWDQSGTRLSAASWFETGLMDPSPSAPAWAGAKWIGGGGEDLVLYAPYLAIFDLSYAITIAPGSTRASFVYGANDSRLMDPNKNLFQLQNAKDQSYIKLELDISAVDGATSGKAKLHVYRAGYKDTDSAATPFRTFEIAQEIINASNKHAEHLVEIRSAFGQITITIDGKSLLAPAGSASTQAPPAGGGFGRMAAPNSVNLNPMGAGGNYLPFGLLCDIGFSVEPGQNASFRAVTVRNSRAPNNVLFAEDLAAPAYRGLFPGLVQPGSGRYSLAGGAKGLFIV
ncbi:MAG: alpha-L-rhamnosidase, partial [Bryobacteraceae bacterium]|nr:alpha-L-rhamnosidase [Bryobacteraceae bacterium]